MKSLTIDRAVENGTFQFVLFVAGSQYRLTGEEVLRIKSEIKTVQLVAPNVIAVTVTE